MSTNNSAILKFGTHFIPQNCESFFRKKFAIPKSEIGKKKNVEKNLRTPQPEQILDKTKCRLGKRNIKYRYYGGKTYPRC